MSPVDRFSGTIETMSNLETLVISVPESLAHGIGHLFNHPFALACLKWCKSSSLPITPLSLIPTQHRGRREIRD